MIASPPCISWSRRCPDNRKRKYFRRHRKSIGVRRPAVGTRDPPRERGDIALSAAVRVVRGGGDVPTSVTDRPSVLRRRSIHLHAPCNPCIGRRWSVCAGSRLPESFRVLPSGNAWPTQCSNYRGPEGPRSLWLCSRPP